MKKKKFKKDLPETMHLEIWGESKFGDYMAKAVDEDDNPCGYKIYLMENKKIKPALEMGDRFIGKISKQKDVYFAKPVARTAMANAEVEKFYGIVSKKEGKFYLEAADKNVRKNYIIDHLNGAKEGDFVSIVLSGDRKFKEARVAKTFGKFNLNKATSALVLEKYDIPYEFSDKIQKECKEFKKFSKAERFDISNLPLVTIDGEDAKDFDDAIWAEKTQNGFKLIVAIADVAYYVRDGSEIDREAYKRGNSVYLPNVVIPMLSEVLCNDLCSLRPFEPRPAIVCFMEIDMQGEILSTDFKRCVIKSAARLTYNEVQSALNGEKNEKTAPIFKSVIQPLFDAFSVLDRARKKRGALELDIEEIKVKVDKDGMISSISKAEHFIAHQIVEEFMILANVAAAKALMKTKYPAMYRIHEKPKEEKLKDIEPLLHSLNMKLPDMNSLKAEHFNRVLDICRIKEISTGISDMVLRLQSQAKYSPENIGHFGLSLKDYVHFTSPIRRYSDLLIHRALISAYKMPEGGGLADDVSEQVFADMGDHLSATERKAVNAERDVTARFVSAYLEPSIGQDFEVKVAGMSNAGLFVRIESIGAEGLLPMSSLPDDDYELLNGNVTMSGKSGDLTFKMGDKIKARLMEASPINGGLIFKFVDEKLGVKYYAKGGKTFGRPKGRGKRK